MRLLLLAAAAVAMSGAAMAQTAAPPSDTVKVMLEKGAVWTVMGFEGEIIYTPDGKWTGFEGQASGTYKVDGNKLCTTSDMGEACAVYPDGKKSGDTFVIELEGLGAVDVKIK
jgi:hypothetical protein